MEAKNIAILTLSVMAFIALVALVISAYFDGANMAANHACVSAGFDSGARTHSEIVCRSLQTLTES